MSKNQELNYVEMQEFQEALQQEAELANNANRSLSIQQEQQIDEHEQKIFKIRVTTVWIVQGVLQLITIAITLNYPEWDKYFYDFKQGQQTVLFNICILLPFTILFIALFAQTIRNFLFFVFTFTYLIFVCCVTCGTKGIGDNEVAYAHIYSLIQILMIPILAGQLINIYMNGSNPLGSILYSTILSAILLVCIEFFRYDVLNYLEHSILTIYCVCFSYYYCYSIKSIYLFIDREGCFSWFFDTLYSTFNTIFVILLQMMPKMLGISNNNKDASFLYGEKRFLKRIPNSRSEDNSNSPNSDLTFDEILASCNLDGRQKIERLISDKGLYSDFLSKAHQLNPHLHEYFYLPLIYIYLEPPASLAFDTVDLEAMISNFGQVLKVINKEKVAYVLMRNNIECWLAVKVLNNTDIEIPAKGLSSLHKLKVLLCFEDATINHVYKFNHTEYREEAFSLVYTDKLVEELGTQYKYISIFEIDVDQTEFDIKSRILGLKGSNIIRIQYLVEKAFAFQNQEKEFSQSDVNIKILLNQDNQCNQLIIMSNNWNKFQLGQKYTNELFAQIKEEFKFFQDNQLASLKESRVKRTDKFFQPIEITYSYDNDQ